MGSINPLALSVLYIQTQIVRRAICKAFGMNQGDSSTSLSTPDRSSDTCPTAIKWRRLMIPAPIGLDWITSIESKQRFRWREIGNFSKQVLYPQALTRTRLALDKKILHPILFLWPERGLCSTFFLFFLQLFRSLSTQCRRTNRCQSVIPDDGKIRRKIGQQSSCKVWEYCISANDQLCSKNIRTDLPTNSRMYSTCTSPSYICNVNCLWSRM